MKSEFILVCIGLKLDNEKFQREIYFFYNGNFVNRASRYRDVCSASKMDCKLSKNRFR